MRHHRPSAARLDTGSRRISLLLKVDCSQGALWLPDTGPPDIGGPLTGGDARAGFALPPGVVRARSRTTAAMQAQAREEGRFLGGRLPYGYRLVDAGPQPNREHAKWGRRLQRLDTPVSELEGAKRFSSNRTRRQPSLSSWING